MSPSLPTPLLWAATGSLPPAPPHVSEHEGCLHDPGEDDLGLAVQADQDVGHEYDLELGGHGDDLGFAGGVVEGHLVWEAHILDLLADQTGDQRELAVEA